MTKPWEGPLPTTWRRQPFWTEFQRAKTLGDGTDELLSVYRDHGVIPKASRDDNFNKPSEDLSKYQLVETGDLVINKMKAWQGSLGVSAYSGIVSPAYFVYKAVGSLDPRFAHYLLRSGGYAQHMAAISAGIRPNQWDLDPLQLSSTPLLVPPADEQRAIADFLDRETSQIDAFIAKNEELIALLTERRTATITRCVTSGLSGSEGLQEGHWTASVPDHWQVMPLRYAIRRIDQGVSPQAEAGLAVDAGQVGVLKSGCVNGGVFQPSEHKILPSDFVFDPAIQIDVGELLVNRASGSVSLLGSAAMVTENPYQLILSDKTFRIWPSGRTSRHYLYWLLNSRLYREQVEASVSGAEGLANNLPMSRLRSFRLPFPPRAEQRKLIVFLERETSAISQAILTASRGIDLARERRAALISAAVTGKIDVGVSA